MLYLGKRMNILHTPKHILLIMIMFMYIRYHSYKCDTWIGTYTCNFIIFYNCNTKSLPYNFIDTYSVSRQIDLTEIVIKPFYLHQ